MSATWQMEKQRRRESNPQPDCPNRPNHQTVMESNAETFPRSLPRESQKGPANNISTDADLAKIIDKIGHRKRRPCRGDADGRLQTFAYNTLGQETSNVWYSGSTAGSDDEVASIAWLRRQR